MVSIRKNVCCIIENVQGVEIMEFVIARIKRKKKMIRRLNKQKGKALIRLYNVECASSGSNFRCLPGC